MSTQHYINNNTRVGYAVNCNDYLVFTIIDGVESYDCLYVSNHFEEMIAEEGFTECSEVEFKALLH